MGIWFKEVSVSEVDAFKKGTLLETLDIRITEIGDEFIKGTMPVDHRTHQPHGVLHGGASLALAESLGSIASQLTVDGELFYCAGIEINANHVRPVSSGRVTGEARPIHLGRSTQVWQVSIHDQHEKLVCISRITMAVLAKERGK